MKKIYCSTISSPIGELTLFASDTALTGLYMRPDQLLERESEECEILRETKKQLSAYFAGSLTHFDIPLENDGTEFQQRVWKELSKIPFGTTISYAELARRVGNTKAVRAVGAANGKNPISIIVPCHRVIGSDGKLVGYGGGLDRKVWLLEHEGCLGSGSLRDLNTICGSQSDPLPF